ncbi:hypothetical protein E3N88_11831 [Mikania micrantha]|uniref:Uncharacterized protein n=1 Tax=Mikania micrantha TaxID=192012 RepID=A0A5N6P435_9ASTR|nr:hypothetical protein E3N88_11831 [Mikania micrantha]
MNPTREVSPYRSSCKSKIEEPHFLYSSCMLLIRLNPTTKTRALEEASNPVHSIRCFFLSVRQMQFQWRPKKEEKRGNLELSMAGQRRNKRGQRVAKTRNNGCEEDVTGGVVSSGGCGSVITPWETGYRIQERLDCQRE